jgi:hypothetical protein
LPDGCDRSFCAPLPRLLTRPLRATAGRLLFPPRSRENPAVVWSIIAGGAFGSIPLPPIRAICHNQRFSAGADWPDGGDLRISPSFTERCDVQEPQSIGAWRVRASE